MPRNKKSSKTHFDLGVDRFRRRTQGNGRTEQSLMYTPGGETRPWWQSRKKPKNQQQTNPRKKRMPYVIPSGGIEGTKCSPLTVQRIQNLGGLTFHRIALYAAGLVGTALGDHLLGPSLHLLQGSASPFFPQVPSRAWARAHFPYLPPRTADCRQQGAGGGAGTGRQAAGCAAARSGLRRRGR